MEEIEWSRATVVWAAIHHLMKCLRVFRRFDWHSPICGMSWAWHPHICRRSHPHCSSRMGTAMIQIYGHRQKIWEEFRCFKYSLHNISSLEWKKSLMMIFDVGYWTAERALKLNRLWSLRNALRNLAAGNSWIMFRSWGTIGKPKLTSWVSLDSPTCLSWTFGNKAEFPSQWT